MKASPLVASILPGLLLTPICHAGGSVQVASRQRPLATQPYFRMVEKVASLTENSRAQELA